MKSRVKKFIKKRSYASWRRRKKLQLPLAFASLFALIMVVYGISLIFAASTVQFSLTPASQSAAPGQKRTYIVRFDPNNNTTRGGSVRVSYDANRLTLTKSTRLGGGRYNVANGTSGTGIFSFTFSATARDASDLYSLEFTPKATTGTVKSDINFVAAQTYAYRSTATSNYDALRTKATLTVQGSAPAAKPLVSVSLNPASIAPGGATTVTWSSSGATAGVGSCSNNFGGPNASNGSFKVSNITTNRNFTVTCTNAGGSTSATQALKVATSAATPAAPSNRQPATVPDSPVSVSPIPNEPLPVENPQTDDPMTDVAEDEEYANSDGSEHEEMMAVSAPPKKSNSFGIVAIVAGVGLLGATAYVYFVKLRPRSALPPATNVNSGLFDDAAASASPGEPGAENQMYPPFIPGDAASVDQSPESIIDEQAYENDNDIADTEISIEHDEMTEEAFLDPQPEGSVSDQSPPPELPEEPTVDIPEPPQDEPPMSPADKVAQAALASLAAQKKPDIQDALHKESILPKSQKSEPQPKPPKKTKPPIDEPKDMFELAAEDPENFGSSQLAETYGEDITKHNEKN